MIKKLFLIALLVMSGTLAIYADTMKLKDGTVLDVTTVLDQGSKYWVKLSDGSTRLINKTDVKEWIKGNGVAPGAPAAGSKNPANSSAASTPSAVPTRGGAAFMSAKAKADKQEAPIVAVQIWEKWIEANASSPDLASAKKELELWTQRNKDEAEKISGKWVGGEDKKKLLKKVEELVTEGSKLLNGNGTTAGLQKLEEALRLYPNSFEANFELGYFNLVKGLMGNNGRGDNARLDKAVKSLESAARSQPNIAATWSNLSIGYNFKKNYLRSVEVAYKATKLLEDKETVQNLVNSIAHAPPGMQNNTKIKDIMDDAVIMAGKHGVDRNGSSWVYLRPSAPAAPGAPTGGNPAEGKPGPAWSGSGFIVTEDGYIVTNHHVATGDPETPINKDISFRVRLDDGTEKNAELIAVDDKADIAIMKIKSDSPLPFLKIAKENPDQGEEALVLGYPASFGTDHTLQISKGTVKSVHPNAKHELWFDLNTTHGNSGGPIVDKEGNLIGILTAGGKVHDMVYVFGVGVKQIESFFKTLEEQSPKVSWVDKTPGLEKEILNSQVLTKQCKTSTVFILAIRGGEATESDGSAKKTADAESPKEEDGADGAAAPGGNEGAEAGGGGGDGTTQGKKGRK